MTLNEVAASLQLFFPGAFKPGSSFIENPDGQRIFERLKNIEQDPLHLTNFNQLLHLVHEAGVSEGFFQYYFLTLPNAHPYPLKKLADDIPQLNSKGISSLKQLEWGLRRFFFDGLLYFGDLRNAYRALRIRSLDEIAEFFKAKNYPTEKMRDRGPILPMRKIPTDDRYLISEVACKAYSHDRNAELLHIEEILLDAYKASGSGRRKIKTLFDKDSRLAKEAPDEQMMLELAAEEFMEDEIENEEEIRSKVATIASRFTTARDSAHQNTRLYLSFVNELDVYVATSMRRRDDFRNMARECEYIFGKQALKDLKVRYFDPTISAAQSHEDKGLIECLMVKCSKVVLYFAGERDSFGKDAEIAMALSLGKPVIILCPDTAAGKQRERFFRDIHPLCRLIDFQSGVAIGAMVTRNPDTAAELLSRLFCNQMEYRLENNGDGYFRLREQLTTSVVRLQTNWTLLREAFWNYYHQTP